MDGKNFYKAGWVSSVDENNTSNYIYHYQTMASEKTILWFRLKMTDASGSVKYSAIRLVEASNHFR
jgi:hypothetical protein